MENLEKGEPYLPQNSDTIVPGTPNREISHYMRKMFRLLSQKHSHNHSPSTNMSVIRIGHFDKCVIAMLIITVSLSGAQCKQRNEMMREKSEEVKNVHVKEIETNQSESIAATIYHRYQNFPK